VLAGFRLDAGKLVLPTYSTRYKIAACIMFVYEHNRRKVAARVYLLVSIASKLGSRQKEMAPSPTYRTKNAQQKHTTAGIR
jgi:hypothetical protein